MDSSYLSMRQKLAPLRLYTLAPGSAADCELKAYAAGLDPLFDALEQDEREAFIGTAGDEGLRAWEMFLEREKPDLPTEKRRALLLGAMRVEEGEATAEGFLHFLHNCGLEQVTVRERHDRQRLSVFIDDRLNEGEKTAIGKKIAQAAPAHLLVTVAYQDGSSIDI